eukprot:TRINITY_DN3405_c0_g1_i1.p1 TRINITY_DN3405_c0_g1~~TRINITY_DN3405_c0_g1_i1.p1  ORF type:complete len:930 (+),score=265.74 TRINITY_DN3405_c0_g1_i1:296-3085(+)
MVAECGYQKYGCEEVFKDQVDREVHMKDHVHQHLDLLRDVLEDTLKEAYKSRQKNDEVIAKLTKTIEEQGKRISALNSIFIKAAEEEEIVEEEEVGFENGIPLTEKDTNEDNVLLVDSPKEKVKENEDKENEKEEQVEEEVKPPKQSEPPQQNHVDPIRRVIEAESKSNSTIHITEQPTPTPAKEETKPTENSTSSHEDRYFSATTAPRWSSADKPYLANLTPSRFSRDFSLSNTRVKEATTDSNPNTQTSTTTPNTTPKEAEPPAIVVQASDTNNNATNTDNLSQATTDVAFGATGKSFIRRRPATVLIAGNRRGDPSSSGGKDGATVINNSAFVNAAAPSDIIEKPIVQRAPTPTIPDLPPPPLGAEWGVVWEYEYGSNEWYKALIPVSIEVKAFADGALRNAHKMKIMGPPVACPDYYHSRNSVYNTDKHFAQGLPPYLSAVNTGVLYVAKISKTPVPAERYFEDVRMQNVCREFGREYNDKGPPKKVDFLTAWVLELTDKNLLYGFEQFIEGEFQKQNSNYGAVLSDRNTPQAFSHFTWEYSSQNLLIVDIQGVEDHYTDPQVHTKDGKGFGLGNLGMRGIERFLKSHKCNPICNQLGLPLMGMELSTNRRRLMRGTMMIPEIVPGLAHKDYINPIPDKFEGGELKCVATLTGHVDRVSALCINSKFLYSSDADGAIKVWDLKTLQCVETIKAHRKSIETLVCNDKILVSGSADMNIKVWNANTFELMETLKEHTGELNALFMTGKFLFSASFDKSIKVWDLTTYKCIKTLNGHSKSVKTITVSGDYLFSGGNDTTIKVWDLRNGMCVYSIEASDEWVKSLVVVGDKLFSGAYDALIKKWNLRTFACFQTGASHKDSVSDLLPAGPYLISISEDATMKIWDSDTLKCLSTIKGHKGGIQSIIATKTQIFTGACDYAIKVWQWEAS